MANTKEPMTYKTKALRMLMKVGKAMADNFYEMEGTVDLKSKNWQLKVDFTDRENPGVDAFYIVQDNRYHIDKLVFRLEKDTFNGTFGFTSQSKGDPKKIEEKINEDLKDDDKCHIIYCEECEQEVVRYPLDIWEERSHSLQTQIDHYLDLHDQECTGKKEE